MTSLVKDPSPSRWQRGLLRAINFYQVGRQGRPSPCRFTPSCSEYSREAVETFGAGRGTWLTLRRLIRCRPFGPSGYDPVPEPSLVSGEISPTPEKCVSPTIARHHIGRSH